MTTIQISDQMKKELLELMADLQKETGSRLTYEDVLRKLLDEYHLKLEERVEFSEKYFGILEGKAIKNQIKESRQLERD